MPTGPGGEPHAVERLMRLLSTRMSWTSGIRVLESAGLHVSRGWSESISAFRGAIYTLENLEAAERVLESALVLHTYVGNKQVTWYDMGQWNPEWVRAIRRWAAALDPASPPRGIGLRRWIPANLPYSEGDLSRYRGASPRLVEISKSEDRVYFQFLTARTYAIRETIDVADFAEEDRERFLGYQEIIGVRRSSMPCFDSCVLDLSANRLEVRIDFNPGNRSDEQAGALPTTIAQFNRIMQAELQIAPAGIGLVNFFPAVGRIYNDTTAGRVSLLGFVATSSDTASNNSGKTLRKQTQDLRQDRFHLGGKQNVQSVLPYTIGTNWPAPSGGREQLTLELHGGVKTVYHPNTVLGIAHLTGCMTTADYDFLIEELARQLRPRTGTQPRP